jgi:uncharacterized protein DUF3551
MRKLAMAGLMSAAAALPFLGGTTPGHSGEGPWCHEFGGAQGGIQNCSIQTLEACRFEIQGNGGSCSPNPHYHGPQSQGRTARGGLYPWPWR